MDTCLDRPSNTGIRVENWVQRSVHLSIRVEDVRGFQDTEGEGGGSIKQSNGGTGFKIRRNYINRA